MIEDKQPAVRALPLRPAGSQGQQHFEKHCTACQLCVSACPNQVLRPASDLPHLMQPEMSYEKGYCRPECNACSQVCPSDAIRPIEAGQKLNMSIGKASVNLALCLSATGEASCGNCARHCPVGAILMVTGEGGRKIPTLVENECTGCGACEFLCPTRPISAITVNGCSVHYE